MLIAQKGFVPLVQPFLPYVVGGAVALLAIVILLRMLRRRDREPAPTEGEKIELQKLPTSGPPADGPRVELYNIPMRLAVVVLAPVGRVSQMPRPDQTAAMLEEVMPGMKRVIETHRPLVRTLPPQLSSQGFARVAFGKLKLPDIDASGETSAQGRGTPWSMVAGRIDVRGNKLLLALVLRADKPNGIGGVELEHENQWLELIKVR